MAGYQVRVHGLRQLRSDLKRIDVKLPRELSKRLKVSAEPVRREAAALAPKRTGATARSLRVSTRGERVAIVSNRPGVKVIHFGGRHPLFGDRDHWYPQKPQPFIATAVSRNADKIERDLARVVEGLMREAGFH